MENSSENLSSRIIKSDSIAGFKLTENTYPSDYQTSLHAHDYTYFCFVLDGAYTLKYQDRAYLCQSSKLLFFPYATDHACYMHTHSRCFNFQLNTQILEYIDENKDFPPNKVIQKSGELDQLTCRLYKEFYTIDEFSPLTVEGLISEITAEFLRQSDRSEGKSAPRWLLLAADFINEEFMNTPTISSIAKISNVHPTHLAREFRRHFQVTIGDFVRKKRVEFACQKIIRSSAPLSEIALEAGFFDQSHFTRIFKKATGMTPAAYRRVFQKC